MKALKTEDIEGRKKKVLQSVIHYYIQNARPVGSKLLAESGIVDLSSATIRNTLAELEEEGYISHPHTSAGRVPTDKGYRYYVETLVDIQRLAVAEQKKIKEECSARIKELENLLSTTSKILSKLSHYTGFVLTPKMEFNRLMHLDLVRLQDQQLLVIMITDSGLIKHQVIEVDWHITPSRLQNLTNMLNEKLVGLTLKEVQHRFIDKLREEEEAYHELYELATSLGKELFKMRDNDLLMDGVSNLLAQVDFDNLDQARSVFKLVDEKRILTQFLRNQLTEKSKDLVNVTIGGEGMCPELEKISTISSVYHMEGRNVGLLGIIGPKRMEYARMIGLVKSVTEILNNLFDTFEKEQ